ncbi:hypothetical protein Pcinc_002237 [Petrolisthes cinctipes]|uniref:Peptidase A2 domain-containing protein n=1 Tax=Petrolisthes cinctipes TaxID=88211 RepID=A0AAE1GIM5_PETCI|nr:hypothetical protein Pcinc_002237 [Petrolisthes cinctipes]
MRACACSSRQLLFVLDSTSVARFLVDTGATVSAVSPSAADKASEYPSYDLLAANGTSIATYGTRTLNLDLGLPEKIIWSFIVADVRYPILGLDFLHSQDLLVDSRYQQLHHRPTTCTIKATPCAEVTPRITHICPEPAYTSLLQEFPELTSTTPHSGRKRHNCEKKRTPQGLVGHLKQRVKSHWTSPSVAWWWSQRRDIMCGRSVIVMMMMVMVLVMVLALTPPIHAGIRTECPAYNQSSMVPQQPLEMNKIGPDVITKLALQDFLKIRVGCWHLYYNPYDKITIPLSFTRFKWEKQPKYLKKKGGECWVELSINNDDDKENHIVLDHKCPFNPPEFPQLQMTVKCPDNVEQCATINFCNTG